MTGVMQFRFQTKNKIALILDNDVIPEKKIVVKRKRIFSEDNKEKKVSSKSNSRTPLFTANKRILAKSPFDKPINHSKIRMSINLASLKRHSKSRSNTKSSRNESNSNLRKVKKDL